MGIMEKKLETTRVYWGYIGIMENKMDIWGYYMASRGYKGGMTLGFWVSAAFILGSQRGNPRG